ncbi:Bud site selection protein 6 [Tulasnella sp. 408]|nr:Bud site selection protein 6 [Tulasnella sp. 408]
MLQGERPVPDERLLLGFSIWKRYMSPGSSLPSLQKILRNCWDFNSAKLPSLSDIWLGVQRTNGHDEDFPGKLAEKNNSMLFIAGSRGGLSSDTPAHFQSSRNKIRGGPSGGVESTVTRLLVTIKQLLESLTSWSRRRISEQDVSDVYVRLENDFNAGVVAFASFDIDIRQVHAFMEMRSVIEDLGNVLETCPAEDAAAGTLERFLPQVREIITDLLQCLRNKQSQFHAMNQERAQRRAERQNSTSTSASEGQSYGRSGSKSRPPPSPRIPEEESEHPTRLAPGPKDSPSKIPKGFRPASPDVKRYLLIDKPFGSSPSSGSAYPFPNVTPSSPSAPTFDLVNGTPSPPIPSGSTVGTPSAPEIPQDPALASQEDILESSIAALQKSGRLERKSSKRFSSYTFSKTSGKKVRAIVFQARPIGS